MTNVLQVSTYFADHGGVEKSVSDLARGLKQTHEVGVLCTRHGAGTTIHRDDGIEVTAVGGRLSLAGRPVAFTFPHELKRKSVDVVHYHLPFPLAAGAHLVAAPTAKLSVATWHHDLVKNPAFNRCIKPMMEAFLDRMDLIFVTAPPIVEHVPMLYKRQKKCRVVPLGIARHRFAESFSPLNIKSRPLVLFVGRLVYYKGCEVLIKAIADIDADLAIVGEGPLGDGLKTLVAELGIANRVEFYGRLPDERLASLYQECDVFVLPSTLPTECFGLVQVEAMLHSKPVINTALPTGVPWVSLNNETGITVPPSDIDALRKALSRLCGDKKLRDQYGAAAKSRAEQFFTLDRHIQTVTELYEQNL